MKQIILSFVFVVTGFGFSYTQINKPVTKLSTPVVMQPRSVNAQLARVQPSSSHIGYLKIPDIQGESQRANHEGEIDLYHLVWSAAQAEASATGAGRRRARSVVEPLIITKKIDKASPYIMLSQLQGKTFREVTITLKRETGDEPFEYLTYMLENVIFTSIKQAVGDSDYETLGMSFEKIRVLYTEQQDDHSAGDEHEIEYDIAAGS